MPKTAKTPTAASKLLTTLFIKGHDGGWLIMAGHILKASPTAIRR